MTAAPAAQCLPAMAIIQMPQALLIAGGGAAESRPPVGSVRVHLMNERGCNESAVRAHHEV